MRVVAVKAKYKLQDCRHLSASRRRRRRVVLSVASTI